MSAKEPKPKRAPRTPKEKAFAKEYIANGGNKVQAALKAYPNASYKSASVIAHENIERLRIVDLMDRVEGLRPQDRIMKLVEGLWAEKQDQFTGEVRPDYATRYKYLELSLKLDGSLKQAETLIQNNLNLQVTPILGSANALPGDDRDAEGAGA